MDIFQNFDLVYFLSALLSGIVEGAILSISIKLNIVSQNKYKLQPTKANNLLQTITYLATFIFGSIIMILIALNLIKKSYHASSFYGILFILSALVVVVIAFKYKWIPDRLGVDN